MLYKMSKKLSFKRTIMDKLSLGDDQSIHYETVNDSDFDLDLELIDELPFQLQHRDNIRTIPLQRNEKIAFSFTIKPKERGEYFFGNLLLFFSFSKLGFAQYRKLIPAEKIVAVVPSILQMKKYELQVFSKTATQSGIRRTRKIGENDEFEHIRAYVQGDNFRAINWKATSRNNTLMVNQFQDSRSQLVYSIIDKGRGMKMPFEGLTLLDYAINSALVVSNIVLKKYDKAGLITFSNKLDAHVKAALTPRQLSKISADLYAQKTNFLEPNFELLYHYSKKNVTRRSILMLYTNFEHEYDMRRALPYLKRMSMDHLLIVILFVNTTLYDTGNLKAEKKSDIYLKTFAQKTMMDKEKIVTILNANGIQTILTAPENLSINVINKYLEVKSRRLG